MKLTVNSKPIALPEKAKISIERSTPLLNDDTGSFSFPFPVPMLPNHQALGWPGKLERTGDIPDQSFVLEDGGMQVFRGEVDFEDVTAKEIGLILKSGYSEFRAKMEDKMLGDIDFGSEWWPISDEYYETRPRFFDKLEEWNIANTTSNGKYVATPFWISPYSSSDLILVNEQLWDVAGPSSLNIYYNSGVTSFTYAEFCLQFRISYLLPKIFESAGFTIVENAFTESEFNKAIIYTNIMSVSLQGLSGGHAILRPALASLEYSTLMPDVKVLDFLDTVKNMFCMMYEINELKKEVRIKFKKDIFLPENLDGMKIPELTGWTHKEERARKGFALRYNSQDNDKDTDYDYKLTESVARQLPAAKKEGQVYRVTDFDREYITEKNSDDVLEWHEIGRLKEYRDGEGENTVELEVNVPAQKKYTYNNTTLECPSIMSVSKNGSNYLTGISILIMTLYHGRKMFGQVSYPYASFDRYSLGGTIDVGMSLKPAYLYSQVYSEFLIWQSYQARPFTKYISLTLPELISLQWGKRYLINGVRVILDKIHFDLPYDGKVKIEGFTG